MSELNNIWKLLKTGSAEFKKRSPLQMFYFIGKMLLILVFFKIATFGIAYLLDSLDIFKIPANLNRARFANFSDIEILLMMAVYGPIKEELAFRLPLKFSKWNLTIATVVMVITFCGIYGLEYIFSFIVALVIGVILYFSLTTNTIEVLSKFWTKNKLLIFYSLLIIFSYLHLGNYEITTELLLFSPIIILPRILGALVFSYLRLSSGILLAICFHAFNNGIFKVIGMVMD